VLRGGGDGAKNDNGERREAHERGLQSEHSRGFVSGPTAGGGRRRGTLAAAQGARKVPVLRFRLIHRHFG
jgi:hypothetical protein